MESVIIIPKNKKELKFVSGLLDELGINSKKFSLKENEDLDFSYMMREADRNKKVSEKIIMKKLEHIFEETKSKTKSLKSKQSHKS